MPAQRSFRQRHGLSERVQSSRKIAQILVVGIAEEIAHVGKPADGFHLQA